MQSSLNSFHSTIQSFTAQMASSDFRVLSESPLNAEPPLSTLAKDFFTPTKSAFQRNHGEIMEKDIETYRLVISSEVEGTEMRNELEFRDIKGFSRVDVNASMSCAGNRRSEMNEEKEVEGLQWGGR